MKKHLFTIMLALVFLIGLSLLLYPTVSDYWNSLHQSQAIASYAEEVAKMDDGTYEEMWAKAVAYNETLLHNGDRYFLSEEEKKEYSSLLNVTGTGMMGYIEIPELNCSLPIYHGTDDGVLQSAVGHLEGTSLPVGGESTHCVLSGHRGLPSAKIFTDLDQMENGDLFILRVLDETLSYEVDQIRIVEPDEMNDLEIEEGRDYCTLVTCTPYGVNTHRLLVRGHRVENPENAGDVRVTADAMQLDPIMIAPIVAIPILLLLTLKAVVGSRKNKSHQTRRNSK
ncbi:MAG: class C sortase [Clostridia bacterium]